MSAVGRWAIVPAPPTSQRSIPRLERTTRATGRVPLGRPYSSTRTLTADRGGKGLSPTTLYGEARGGNSPPPDVVIVADEGTLTRVSRATDKFSCSLTLPRPKDVALGFVLGPLTQGRGLSSIPKPIPNRLGWQTECVWVYRTRKRDEGQLS